MKSLALVSLLLGASLSLPFDTIRPREVKKSRMGAVEIIDYYESGMKKLVQVPQKSYIRDYS